MQAKSQKFDPNLLTFGDGLKRIARGNERAKLKLNGRILTSRDKDVERATDILQVDNIPDGFKKWQLPVYLDSPSQLFISTAAANTTVPEHAHRDGDGIRFIVAGSIIYNGVELTAGDWMFIPKGQKYSFQVGRLGATMCYCYCCCCAGAMLHGEEVVNPGVLSPA